MLNKKKVWSIINKARPKFNITAYTKKKIKDKAITSKIIKQKINLDLYTNIIKKCHFY